MPEKYHLKPSLNRQLVHRPKKTDKKGLRSTDQKKKPAPKDWLVYDNGTLACGEGVDILLCCRR